MTQQLVKIIKWLTSISAKRELIDKQYFSEVELNPPLEIANLDQLNEEFIMELRRRLGNKLSGLPLFKVTGTAMDIDQMTKKSNGNKDTLGKEVFYQGRPSLFEYLNWYLEQSRAKDQQRDIY